MIRGKLTARRVETAPPGRHEDGAGLRLVVSSSGARRWVLRYTCQGRRREMGLGSYPIVSLAEARELALTARRQAAAGVDPIEARKLRQVDPAIPTFVQVAAEYIRQHRRGWRNRKHQRQWVSTLKTYARPVIGDRLIDQITTDDVLAILRPVWNDKTETAKRVQGRIENVLDYAAARRMRDPMNPARWRGHLDKLLPKPARVKRVRHHPAMPWADVPAFYADLVDRDSGSAYALRWLILTATRTGETLGARWDEIDEGGGVWTWTIPAERMKTAGVHRVPLPGAALRILDDLPRVDGNPYLFPGARRGRPLSNMALLKLMRSMGYGQGGDRGAYVPHGFRSAFRDWCAEQTPYPREVVEMALAHTVTSTHGAVEAAYRRGDLLDRRRDLMAAWARYLLG